MPNKLLIDLDKLKKFRQEYDKRLKDGKIVPLLSKELTPVSEQSGSTQETPFINQGTATNNNDSQAEVDTGSNGEHLQKQGNAVVVNQQVRYLRDFDANDVVGSHVGSLYTLNGIATDNINTNIVTDQYFKQGHKYLIIVDETLPSGVRVGVNYSGDYTNKIYTADSDLNSVGLSIYIPNGTEINVSFHIYNVDITKWFNCNDNIPTDLLNHPEHWSWYYNGSLAYNTGTLTPSNGRYLECGQGRNIYNPEETYNGVIPNRKYHYYKSGGSATTITYYDKDKNAIDTESVNNDSDFTTPPNCWFINSSVSSPTISLWYATGDNYSQEYPYVAPKRYDTGTETLLRIPVAGGDDIVDTKAPDGTITRRVDSRAYESGDESDNSVWTDGTTTYYALETPRTEKGTAFSENIGINDMSYMAWFDTDGNLVSIPQGCKLFYPAWIKGFVDSVGQREDIDWAAEKIASISQLLPQKSNTRLQKTLTLTGANSEEWSTSGSYSSVKRFNLLGTFYRYIDSEHPRGIGTATSTDLNIAWIQDNTFSAITNLSMCFYGGTEPQVPQLILLIPNSEGVSTVEQLRTWLSSHNISVSYDSSKYQLEATMMNDTLTYEWVPK